jgi:hypothetical protein
MLNNVKKLGEQGVFADISLGGAESLGVASSGGDPIGIVVMRTRPSLSKSGSPRPRDVVIGMREKVATPL